MPDENAIELRTAPPRLMTGRLRVRSDVGRVDASNAVEVLNGSVAAFASNVADIEYLWRYAMGDQPIRHRVKDVRPEIVNRVVENHAKEVVDFKVGYQLNEPVQYVLRNHDGTVGPVPGEGAGLDAGGARDGHYGEVNELNTLMFADGKESVDHELFTWMAVCGIGFRMVESAPEGAEAPFAQHCLDPRSTFVIESTAYHHRPLAGVWVGLDAEGAQMWNVWTPDRRIIVCDGRVVSDEPHTYGGVPIIEYQLNAFRMGAFEPALPLLDAINTVESNRLDGVEQTVQSLMKFINCDIDEETFEAMLRLGAVKVSSSEQNVRADVDFIRNDLDQSAAQVTKDDLYQAVVNICGMPNRNGTSGSSSDTGAAVLLRDGWSLAESHAKGYELQFKASERRFLAVALEICRQSRRHEIELRLSDVELAFNRRNYENLLVKAQALTGMLPQGFSIHPELAWKLSGITNDPEAAYLQSLAWTREHGGGAAQEPSDPGPVAGAPETGDIGPTGPSA